MLKSRLSVIAIILFLGIATPINVQAEKKGYIGAEAEYGFHSGGENVQYTLDDSGVLTITGERKMQDNSSFSILVNDKDKVREIIIEEGVTNVGDHVFSSFYNLEKVTLPKSIEVIGESSFYKCEKLKSIVIPEGVKTIKKDAFDNCLSLSQVSFPDSLERIEDWAFQAAPLKTVVIPKNVSFIGTYNFYGLSSVSVAKENTTFDSRNNCNAIIETDSDKLLVGSNSTVIPSTVASMGERAFAGCGKSSFVIPSTVREVGKYAFEGSGFTSFTVPGNITYINENVFSGCKNLKSVTFSEGVKEIGEMAFYNCDALQSISLPKSIELINSRAFSGCPNLKTVNYAGTDQQWKGVNINLLSDAVSGYKAWYPKAIASLNEDEISEVDYLLSAAIKTASDNSNTKKDTKKETKKDTKTDTKKDTKKDTATVTRKANTLKVKAKKPSLKYKKLKKKKLTIKKAKAFTIKKAEGKVTFKKLKGNKKIKINKKSGVITVKKGLKKGSYPLKVKVTAAGNADYKAGSKTVTVKIKVK